MRKVALLLIAITVSLYTLAQDVAREAQAVAARTVKNEGGKTKGSWTKGGQFTINLNQGGFDNWISAGDANWSIGANGYINLFANKAWAGKRSGKAKQWNTNLDIFEGVLNVHNERTDANTFNKLDDRIDLLSKFSVPVTNKISFATVANVRTQLYDTKRVILDSDGKIIDRKRQSGFFAPAVVTLAPGFQWNPTTYFSAFLSPLSNRWVVVSNGPNSLVSGIPSAKPFGVFPNRKVDWQPGAFAQFLFNKALGKEKKVNLKSRLDLYANYANDPQNVDIFFDNYLSFKITKWVSVGVNMTMIYDNDIKSFGWNRDKAGLQYNHNIGFGITRKF